MDRINQAIEEDTSVASLASNKVASFHKPKKPTEKQADVILTGKYKNQPIHVSAYVLRNGKASLKCDLCEGRQVIELTTLQIWVKDRIKIVGKVVPLLQSQFVSVTLCGYKITILRADIRSLVTLVANTPANQK